jgi:hydrogenase maturation protein HypF
MRTDNKIIDKKIQLPFKVKFPVLAFGAQAKNTLCFASGNSAYLSRVHNNLNDPDDFLLFKKTVKYFFKENPGILALDLHPEYQSVKYALSILNDSKSIVYVQHHHAHIASCMAENGLENKKVIGVAFDGTGLGLDNRIWGAEFLVCDYKNLKRAGHLQEIPLIGGEKAISEPWRLAAAWLDRAGLRFEPVVDKNKWAILKNICSKNINSPLVSSMGRLFDAAACVILAKRFAHFEAELAIELEKVAIPGKEPSAYNFVINKTGNGYIIDPVNIFKGIVSDLKHKKSKEMIAFNFHLTIAEMIRKTCLKIRKDTGLRKVVLSGGVFQNKLLLRLSLDLLCKEDFEVFTHKILSPNDSGISLGQAVVAGESICV